MRSCHSSVSAHCPVTTKPTMAQSGLKQRLGGRALVEKFWKEVQEDKNGQDKRDRDKVSFFQFSWSPSTSSSSMRASWAYFFPGVWEDQQRGSKGGFEVGLLCCWVHHWLEERHWQVWAHISRHSRLSFGCLGRGEQGGEAKLGEGSNCCTTPTCDASNCQEERGQSSVCRTPHTSLPVVQKMSRLSPEEFEKWETLRTSLRDTQALPFLLLSTK